MFRLLPSLRFFVPTIAASAPAMQPADPEDIALGLHPGSIHFFDFAGGIIGISPGAHAVAYGGIGGGEALTRWSRPRFARRKRVAGRLQFEVWPRSDRRPSARGIVVTDVLFTPAEQMPSGPGTLGIVSFTLDYCDRLADLMLVRTEGTTARLQFPELSPDAIYFSGVHLRALEVALLRALPCRGELAVPKGRR